MPRPFGGNQDRVKKNRVDEFYNVFHIFTSFEFIWKHPNLGMFILFSKFVFIIVFYTINSTMIDLEKSRLENMHPI